MPVLSDIFFAVRMTFLWRVRCGYWDFDAIATAWRLIWMRMEEQRNG